MHNYVGEQSYQHQKTLLLKLVIILILGILCLKCVNNRQNCVGLESSWFEENAENWKQILQVGQILSHKMEMWLNRNANLIFINIQY